MAVDATYFDGKSSASRHIILDFHDSRNELYLQTDEGVTLVWYLADLQMEQYGLVLEIRNNKDSGAILKVENLEFSRQFYEKMKLNNRVDLHMRLVNLGFSKIVAIAVSLLALIVLSYFFVLPPVAEKSASLLPQSFDDYIGDMFMETFLPENDVDSVETSYLNEFAAELNLHNQKPLDFTVVKSDEVNAFALPNGQIVVYSAILDEMKSSDELVALLAHEATHVNERHSVKMLSRNLAGYMLVSLLFSDINGIMAVLAENAQQLHSLAYSRKFEQEADEQGLQILMDNKVNPFGMVQLFEHLEDENPFTIPKILSTHPLTLERKENMQKIISETSYEVKPNETLKAIFEKFSE